MSDRPIDPARSPAAGPATDPAPVPPAYRGVWSRTLLRAPGRPDDTTTFVRWLQTARWHADLRVPAGARPAAGDETAGPSPSAPANVVGPATVVDPRAWHQGFSGRTMVDRSADGRDRCHWLRQVDLQPPGLTPDVGYVHFETPERLIETGVWADYHEVWDRQAGATGPTRVLRALPPSPGTAAAAREPAAAPAVWLRTGDHAMRVRPRTADWPGGTAPGDTLVDVLRRHPATAAALLDFEISYGRIADDAWTITHSTLPALEGRVLPWRVVRLDAAHAAVDGPGGRTRWQVLEWDDEAPAPLSS